jgi:hypothetical protein
MAGEITTMVLSVLKQYKIEDNKMAFEFYKYVSGSVDEMFGKFRGFANGLIECQQVTVDMVDQLTYELKKIKQISINQEDIVINHRKSIKVEKEDRSQREMEEQLISSHLKLIDDKLEEWKRSGKLNTTDLEIQDDLHRVM